MQIILLNNYSHHPFSHDHLLLRQRELLITFTNNLEQLDDTLNGVIFSDISDQLPIVHVFNANILVKMPERILII